MRNEKMNKRKAFYILLAILISAAIWYFVDEFGNGGGPYLVEQKVTDIPIEYISEDTLTDRGLMLLKECQRAAVHQPDHRPYLPGGQACRHTA